MRGINPKYIDKLDEGQRNFILTPEGEENRGSGKFFLDNFIFVPAEHVYVIGPTGSGKTNKNYNLVNWLKHTEVIFWISASKDNDITPLFFMGLPVNIIVPKYAGIEITLDKEPVKNIVYSVVDDPEDIFYVIKNDHINILEVRNAFWDRNNLLDWMIRFFTLIAEWTRNGSMPMHYYPPGTFNSRKTKISVFIDESQWLIAGSRVTSDPRRSKATEVIIENALEIRTYGWRLAISAQGFTNTPPALRENMACVVLCNNADIEDPPRLRVHCKPGMNSIWIPTSRFKRNECKFINRNGECMPKRKPLPWPLYPKDEQDREKAERIKIKYSRTYHDQHSDAEEIQFAPCFLNLGRLSDTMIEEKPTEDKGYNLYYLPEVTPNE
jgi:hypothetical protein